MEIEIFDEDVLGIRRTNAWQGLAIVDFLPIEEGGLAACSHGMDVGGKRIGFGGLRDGRDLVADGQRAVKLAEGETERSPQSRKQAGLEVIIPTVDEQADRDHEDSNSVGGHAPRAEMAEDHRLDEGQPNGGTDDAAITGPGDEPKLPENRGIEDDVEHRPQSRDREPEELGPPGEKNRGAIFSLAAACDERGGFRDFPPGEQQIDQ